MCCACLQCQSTGLHGIDCGSARNFGQLTFLLQFDLYDLTVYLLHLHTNTGYIGAIPKTPKLLEPSH